LLHACSRHLRRLCSAVVGETTDVVSPLRMLKYFLTAWV
jgi:hypothetical protein